jgi:hypothetical protein
MDNRVDWPKDMSTGMMFPNEMVGRYYTDGIIKNGKVPSPLIIVGCIVYRDQFGYERRTRFCHGGLVELENVTVSALFYQCPVGVNDAY